MGKGYPWAHSKELQLRDDVIDYTLEDRNPTSGVKKFECKKLKGLHQFVSVQKTYWVQWPGGFEVFSCTGCGKKNHVSFN